MEHAHRTLYILACLALNSASGQELHLNLQTGEANVAFVAPTADGGLVARLSDHKLLRIAADGELLWSRTLNANFSTVVETADGGFWLPGRLASDNSIHTFLLYRLDANGDLLFHKRWQVDQTDWMHSEHIVGLQAAVDNDGALFLQNNQPLFGLSIRMKFTATGDLAWIDSYSLPHVSDSRAAGIHPTNDGGCIFTQFAVDYGAVMVRYNSAGERLWTKRRKVSAPAAHMEGGTSVRLEDGSTVLILSAYTATSPSYSYAILEKYNVSGDLVWQRSFRRGWPTFHEPYGSVQAENGNVWVATEPYLEVTPEGDLVATKQRGTPGIVPGYEGVTHALPLSFHPGEIITYAGSRIWTDTLWGFEQRMPLLGRSTFADLDQCLWNLEEAPGALAWPVIEGVVTEAQPLLELMPYTSTAELPSVVGELADGGLYDLGWACDLPEFQIGLQVMEAPGAQTFSLHPNPVEAGHSAMLLAAGSMVVRLWDGSGRLLRQQRVERYGETFLDTSGLGAGVYLLQAQGSDGVPLGSQRLVVY